MKIKQPSRFSLRTAEQQRHKTQRMTGGVLWTLLAGMGIFSIFSGVSGGMQMPSPAALATSAQRALDSSLTEHSLWHDTLVRVTTKATLLSGGNYSGGVYITDSSLLEEPELLEEEQLTETAGILSTVYQSSQIPMCVAAVPSPAEFYQKEQCKGAVLPSQLSQIDSFYQQLPSPIRKIDIYHVLFNATDDYIYHRTDSRWTCYGAYCVYRNAIRKMGFAPISYDQFVVNHTGTFRGELYEACLYDEVMPDILDIYTCDSGTVLTEMTALLPDGTRETRELYQLPPAGADYNDYYLGGSCDMLTLKTNLNNQKKLLLLKDSYADCMVPFLLQHYSEICIIDVTDTSRPMGELTDLTEYTQILVLCDADTFGNSAYFSALFATD